MITFQEIRELEKRLNVLLKDEPLASKIGWCSMEMTGPLIDLMIRKGYGFTGGYDPKYNDEKPWASFNDHEHSGNTDMDGETFGIATVKAAIRALEK